MVSSRTGQQLESGCARPQMRALYDDGRPAAPIPEVRVRRVLGPSCRRGDARVLAVEPGIGVARARPSATIGCRGTRATLSVQGTHMRHAVIFLFFLASTSIAATPPCDVSGVDASAIASARATVEATCDCSSAFSRAAWQRCVRDTLEPLIGSSLSTSCARVVRRTENRSTCGTNKEVCCRTDRRGTTRGALRT